MEVLTIKIITIILTAVVSIILGLLPIKLSACLAWNVGDKPSRSSRILVSVLLCFGGGVLLSTCFVHMLPEVRTHFEEFILKKGIEDRHLPLAEIVVCCGFFVVYLVEELIHLLLDSLASKEDRALHRTMSGRRCRIASEKNETFQEVSELQIYSDTSQTDSSCMAKKQQNYSNKNLSGTIPNASGITQDNYECKGNVSISKQRKDSTESGTSAHENGNDHSHSIPLIYTQDFSSITTSLRGVLAVLALSFHAVFEGLAVGLEESPTDIWTLFAAIASHKFVISFCIGMELLTAGTNLAIFVLYIIIFALVSPIGIAIGLLVTENFGESAATHILVVAILQGVAAGTLLYVVFFEVLQRERTKTAPGLLQLFSIVVGFAMLVIVELFAGHEHGHEDFHEYHREENVTTNTATDVEELYDIHHHNHHL